MKFDFRIGNPPYQNGKQQIYPAFYVSSQQISNCVELIFPTGWQDPKSANGLKIVNNTAIKEDRQIVFIDNRHNVFSGITGAEWTNIILWKKDYDNGLNGYQKILTNGAEPTITKLLTDKSQIVLNKTISDILTKVKNNMLFGDITQIIYIQNNLNLTALYNEYPETESVIGSEGRDKRFERNIFDKLPVFFEEEVEDAIQVIGNQNNKRTRKFIYKKYVETSHPNLYKYKLIVSAAAAEAFGSKLSEFIVGKPGEAFTRSYISFGAYDDEQIIYNISKYLKTKFARTMLFTLKTSRMNNRDVWANVPMQDFSCSSDINWSQSISEIDQQLYKKYGLSEEEIQFIETNVKEME